MKKTVKVPASIEVIKDAKELAQVQGGRKRPGRAKFG
jgi:hypothetical protein